MSCDVLSPSVLSCTVSDARASRGGVCSRDLWFELVSSAVPGGLKTTVRNGFARVPDNVFSRDSLLIRAPPLGINQSDIARCRYTATCTVYIGHRSKEDACDSEERREREREKKLKKKKISKRTTACTYFSTTATSRYHGHPEASRWKRFPFTFCTINYIV